MVQGGHLVFTGPAEAARGRACRDSTSAFKEAAVEYDFTLRAGGTRVFRFAMPAVPTSLDQRRGRRADCGARATTTIARRTIAFWKAEVAQGRPVLGGRSEGDEHVQDEPGQRSDRAGSRARTAASISASTGFTTTTSGSGTDRTSSARTTCSACTTLARETLDAFLVWQDGKPVGFFKPGAPQPPGARLSVQDDYWGQVLWAMGAHIRTTGDRALLEQIYPLLGPHIDEFVAKCAADPRGLWPVAGPYDNEEINGHYTGPQLLGAAGLEVRRVHGAGRWAGRPTPTRWQKIHDDYEAELPRSSCATLAAKSDGYIPPGMDSVTDGNDWANASGGLYPFEVLAKDDPLARQTLEMVRDYNYQEGIMTYGGNAWVAKQQKQAGNTKPHGTLHHYETFYVTEGNTILGEQRKVIEDLYSILAHTGSTNARLRVRHSGLDDARSAIELHAARLVRRPLHGADPQPAGARGGDRGAHHVGAGAAVGRGRAGRSRSPTRRRSSARSATRSTAGRTAPRCRSPISWKDGRAADRGRVPHPVVRDAALGDDRRAGRRPIAGGAISTAAGRAHGRGALAPAGVGAEPELRRGRAPVSREGTYRKPAGADYDFLFPVIR